MVVCIVSGGISGSSGGGSNSSTSGSGNSGVDPDPGFGPNPWIRDPDPFFKFPGSGIHFF